MTPVVLASAVPAPAMTKPTSKGFCIVFPFPWCCVLGRCRQPAGDGSGGYLLRILTRRAVLPPVAIYANGVPGLMGRELFYFLIGWRCGVLVGWGFVDPELGS